MNSTSSRQGAFTLVEMLVAIAVLSILLSVVFVPLRLAINSYHIGSSRTTAQNAAQASLDDMERDLRRAAYVFPNTALAGVTDKAPYINNRINSTDTLGVPYTKSLDDADAGASATRGVCERIFLPAKPVSSQQKAVAFANTSRVDMILAVRGNGGVVLPVRPDDTVVTYYTRRQNISQPYNPVDNPMVLFRAEMPYRDTTGVLRPNGTTTAAPTATDPANADLSPTRLDACGGMSNSSDRGSLWLAHNVYGEANLEPLVEPGTTTKGVQTLAIPRGIGLVASQAFKLDTTVNPTPPTPTVDEAPLVPDTSFQLSDTNGDGKIDHVSASLALEVFDTNQGAATGTNGQPTGQIVRAHRDFDLPNVR